MRQVTYEFVVPSGVFLVDIEPWESLALMRSNFPMHLRKPIPGQKLVSVAETIGNEGVDLHYTVMRVDVGLEDGQPNPEWYVPFQPVSECLNWIRVVGRQYLVDVFKGGTSSIARGSIISETGGYTNFGAVRPPVVVHPLSREVWKWIGDEMANGEIPTVPDMMFCDALSSFHEHDFLQTIILLGVASELELNAFVDDLLTIQNDSIQRLYNERRFKFEWKLKNIPEIMGAQSYQEHNKIFSEQLCKLYELRGRAVHRADALVDNDNEKTGKAERVGLTFGHVVTFIYAVQDFLHWTKKQRGQLGLKTAKAFDSPIRAIFGG